jgi:acetyl esterase/lipase
MKNIILFSAFFLSTFFIVNAQEDSDPPALEEFTYDVENQLKIYRALPSEYDAEKQYPAIIIFHGGGWAIGEASWGFSNARHYASKGIIAFSVQYRLEDSEKGITPYESVLDAQTAIRWVRENAANFSINENKIAAYGWSAGAHLAACAAIFENLDTPDQKVSSAPNLLALKSPALSLLAYRQFQKRLGDKIKVENISPAEHVSETTPPSIIVIGRADTVTPLEGSELFHTKMIALGNDSQLHIYDKVGHLFTPDSEPDDGWPNPDKEVYQKAQAEIDAFLEKHGYIMN